MSNEAEIKEIDVVIERRGREEGVDVHMQEDDADDEWREETLIEHIGRAARENPASAALVGAGLVWMALGGARNVVRGVDVAGTVVGDAARAAGSTARHAARAVGYTVATTAESAQEVAGRAAETAARTTRNAVRASGEAASETVDATSRKASRVEDYAEGTARRAASALSEAREEIAGELHDAIDAVRRGGERALQAAGDLAQNRPVLFSALCLAAGAGAAALLPRTRTEDELLGQYSGEATRAARQRAANLVSGSVRAARARTSDAVHQAAHKAAEDAAERVLKQAGGIGEAVIDTFDKVIRDEGASKEEKSSRDESKGSGRS